MDVCLNFSHVKIWNHPTETTIYKRMFQVPRVLDINGWCANLILIPSQTSQKQKNTQEMDLGLGIWLPCVCCSSGLSYVLSNLSCWSCVTCHVHFIQLPVEGCHGKDFCTTLRPWKICTRPSGPRKRPEESRETRFTSAILVATSVNTDLCATRGWHMWRHGPLFHLKSCNLAILCPMRHAPWRGSCQVGSFWNLAKFADYSSHELRILWDFRCGLLQDLSKGGRHTCSSMWATTTAFHCWLRMNATTCEHKSIRDRQIDLNQSLPSMSSVASCWNLVKELSFLPKTCSTATTFCAESIEDNRSAHVSASSVRPYWFPRQISSASCCTGKPEGISSV